MKIYVSAPSKDASFLKFVKSQMRLLEAEGHTVTLDWTTQLAGTQTEEQLQTMVSADLRAVAEADCVLVLAQLGPTVGCWVEIGAALVLGKPVAWIHGDNERSGDSHFFGKSELITNFSSLYDFLSADKAKTGERFTVDQWMFEAVDSLVTR